MNYQQVDQLIAIYGSKLPYEALGTLREKLLGMDYNTASIYLAQSKDPTIAIILSVLVGSLGIDRIYIGDVVIGILKLITCDSGQVPTVHPSATANERGTQTKGKRERQAKRFQQSHGIM